MADADTGVTGIVITGAGDVFSSGLDIPAIQAGGDPVEFATALVGLLKLIPTPGTPGGRGGERERGRVGRLDRLRGGLRRLDPDRAHPQPG